MKRAEVIKLIDEAFADALRPTMFIRGTCSCEECAEHDETMQGLRQKELPLEPLNNPGWDPICFASNAAFKYLMPGLARLVLDHPDDYLEQFLFHIVQPERVASLSPDQARALVEVLDVLALEESAAVDNCLAADDLFKARKQLEPDAPPGTRQPS